MSTQTSTNFGLQKAAIKDRTSTVFATRILLVDIPEGADLPVIGVTLSNIKGAGTGVNKNYALRYASYDRVVSGSGTNHPQLQEGLMNNPSFLTQLVLRKEIAADGKTPYELCLGVHAYPTPNYLQCDMALELGKSFKQGNSILVNVHQTTGELDVYSCPGSFYMLLPDFFAALDKLDNIPPNLVLRIGGYQLVLSEMIGTLLTFTVRKS